MKRAEQLKRRERMLEALQKGVDPMQVAIDEQVSWTLIYGICRMAGIKIAKPRTQAPLRPLKREFHDLAIRRAFDILAELRTGERTLKGIGTSLGVSPQWVSEVRTMALERDLLLPRGAKAFG